MRPDASENSQINPSTIVRAARAAGSQPHLASGFQGRCKIATLHADFGVIRGMSVETFFEAGATPRPDDLTAVMLVDDEFDAEECCRAMQAYCCEVVLVPKPLAQHRLRPGQAIRLRRQQPGPSPLRRCQLAQAAPGGTGSISVATPSRPPIEVASTPLRSPRDCRQC